MSRLPDLADRIERLLLRHDEQKRTNALLEQQLRNVTDERDNLRSRLAAARARIDALIDRLPASEGGHAADEADTGDSSRSAQS
jgi:cell division protein ZapB